MDVGIYPEPFEGKTTLKLVDLSLPALLMCLEMRSSSTSAHEPADNKTDYATNR